MSFPPQPVPANTTKTATNAVHLAPLLAEWKGTPNPVLLFGGRRGQLMTLDLFDNDQGNYNAAVIGTSGSGKSVLLNEIAWSYRAIGAKVWMLDLGRSFEKLCRVCDGQMIEFRASATINVNPFSAVTDIHDDMAMLQPVVAKMASPLQALEPFAYKAIASAILIAWETHGPAMTVTHIRDVLATGRLRATACASSCGVIPLIRCPKTCTRWSDERHTRGAGDALDRGPP